MPEEQHDLEPGTMFRRLHQPWRSLALAIGVGWSLFQLTTLCVYPIDPWMLRSIHLGFASILTLLLIPATKRSPGRYPSPLDLLLAFATLSIVVYIGVNLEELVYRIGIRPTAMDAAFGAVLILLTLELGRRLTGPALPVIATLAVLYALYGAGLPGLFGHGGYDWDRVSTFLLGTDGIYGDAMAASATFVSLFILFGAFLAISGASNLFSDLAMSLAGGVRGGPAKVSVIASSMFGTISGSAVANVMVDGWLTIPTMTSAGFRPAVAGAVEAVASCGGQIMPPIMSASAFVMSQITGIPYATIALAAVVPAVLFYLGLYWMIDFYAAIEGLRGLPRAQLPPLKPLMRDRGYLLLPVVGVFVALLVFETSAIRAGLVGLLLTIAVAHLKSASRFNLTRVVDALYRGATGMLAIAATCACAGVVIGILALTGLGQKFVSILVAGSGGSLPVAMILSAVTIVILGMGVPTVGAYIIGASTAAPALVLMGIPELAAHLFVLYFAAISTITPPVAIAVYAAAGIARASIWRTGWEAVCLAFAGYLVPFLFMSRSGILLRGDIVQIVEDITISVVAVTMIAAGFRGWLFYQLLWWEKPILIVAAALLLDPGLETTAAGLGASALVVVRNLVGWLRLRRAVARSTSQEG